MAAEAIFVDTNVLVYAGRPTAAQHPAARARLLALEQEGCTLWVSPQVMREYLAVVTRPQADIPPMKTRAPAEDIQRFRVTFTIASETEAVFERLLQLMETARIGGAQVHDANLVATMLEHGVHRLLTSNTRDFRRFAGIIDIETI